MNVPHQYPNFYQPTSSGPPSGSMMSSWGNPPLQQPAYHAYQPITTVESFPSAQWPVSYPSSDFNQSAYVSSYQSNTSSYNYSPLDPAQPVEDGQRGPYKCRWCERVFAHESSKCCHEKEHFNSFPCPWPGCSVVSSRKDSLKRHERLMHGGSRLISDLQSKLENRIGPKPPLSRDEGAFKEKTHERVQEETQKRVQKEAQNRWAQERRMAQEKAQEKKEVQEKAKEEALSRFRELATGRFSRDEEAPFRLQPSREQVRTVIEKANSSDFEEAFISALNSPVLLEHNAKRTEDQLAPALPMQKQEKDRNPPGFEMSPERTREHIDATEDIGARLTFLGQLGGLWRATTNYFFPIALSPAKRRLKWHCACGHTSYDDFLELSSGALAEMQTLLEARRNCTLARDERPFGERPPQWRVSSFFSVFGSFWIFCSSLFVNRNPESSSPELPQHLNKQGRGAETAGRASASTSSSLHVLLSFPYYSHGSRLCQPPIKNMRTDREFFKLLRVSYDTTRSRFKRLFSLKTIRSVKFVQLERFRSDLVDIRKVDDLPPPADDEYVYDPKPPELVPPVGENLMLHLFLHPDHADDFTAVLLKRVPKKNNILSTCPVKGSGLGWGIHFGGGWHYGLLWFCLLLLTILGSVVFLVCWAVLEHDVQGASGVAGYVLVLITAAGGSLQAAIEMEVI